MSRQSGFVWFVAFLAGCLPAQCTPPPDDGGPPVILPPETVAVTGTLQPASGLTASDFVAWDEVADEPGAVAADGRFSGEASGRRATSLLFVPKEGSAAATQLADGGFYLSPTAGVQHLGLVDGKYVLAETGDVRVDATTTVLGLVMQHPMLSNPWHAMAQVQLAWLVGKANAGWPALQAAASAWDAALAGGLDPASDAGFRTALQEVLAAIADEMPEPAPLEAQWVEAAQGADGQLPFVLLNDGRRVSVVRVKDNDGKAVKVEPYNERGTALDYFYEVREASTTAYPDGLESPRFERPSRLSAPDGNVVATGFVGARSYASYLDIVGNTVGYVSKKVGEAAGIAPSGEVVLSNRRFYEVRFLSGGFQGGNDAADYTFTAQNYGTEARSAFLHNISTVVIETLATLPGGDAIFGEGIGGEVLQAVVLQAGNEVEALMNLKSPSTITGEDIYGVVYNVVKAAVDQVIASLASEPQERGLKKLFNYMKWGAKTTFKELVGLPGKIAKGGSAANRAMRIARPESVIEFHAAAVGFEPKQTAGLFLHEKIDGICLGLHGNQVRVSVDGQVEMEGGRYAVESTEHTMNDMGEFIQTNLRVDTNDVGGLFSIGAVARNLSLYYTEPDEFETTGDLGAGRRYVWTWLGFQSINVAHQWKDGTWHHATVQGKRYSASNVALFGASFTGVAKTRYRYYEVVDEEGNEQMTESFRYYNYILTFQ